MDMSPHYCHTFANVEMPQVETMPSGTGNNVREQSDIP
jgi:hypothetical protein